MYNSKTIRKFEQILYNFGITAYQYFKESDYLIDRVSSFNFNCSINYLIEYWFFQAYCCCCRLLFVLQQFSGDSCKTVLFAHKNQSSITSQLYAGKRYT